MSETDNLVSYYYVDVDQSGDLAAAYGVSSIPTLVLIKDGQEVKRAVGYMPESKVLAFAHD